MKSINVNNFDDQLMVFCWTGMLPLAIALVVLVPSILVAFDISPNPLIFSYEESFL